jgi:hypothetical protein
MIVLSITFKFMENSMTFRGINGFDSVLPFRDLTNLAQTANSQLKQATPKRALENVVTLSAKARRILNDSTEEAVSPRRYSSLLHDSIEEADSPTHSLLLTPHDDSTEEAVSPRRYPSPLHDSIEEVDSPTHSPLLTPHYDSTEEAVSPRRYPSPLHDSIEEVDTATDSTSSSNENRFEGGLELNKTVETATQRTLRSLLMNGKSDGASSRLYNRLA